MQSTETRSGLAPVSQASPPILARRRDSRTHSLAWPLDFWHQRVEKVAVNNTVDPMLAAVDPVFSTTSTVLTGERNLLVACSLPTSRLFLVAPPPFLRLLLL